MTVTLEIPEELARRLGPEAARMSREALALEPIARVFGPKPNSANSLN